MKLLWGVLAAALAAWGLTLAVDPPASLDIWVVRKQAILLTGVASFALMSLIMLLAVRPVWLEKPLDGLDRMYRLHKWAGILAIVLGLLHYLLELAGPWLAGIVGKPVKGPRVETFLDVFRGSAKELGEWSAWILGGMLLITLWQRFPYHLWRYVHKALALVYLVLAFHSVVLAPASYWSQPAGWLVAACALLGSACALLSLSGRIGRARRHAGVVTAVERHGESLLEVTCRLQGDWSHRAGQFAFLTCDRLEGAHPFTIASADRGCGEVRFSIKALGDYTRRLGQPGGRRQGRGGGAIRLLRLPPWPGRAAGLGRRRDRRDAVHRLAGVAAGRAGKRAIGGAALLRAQFPGSAVRRALARALRTPAQRDPAHPL